MPKNCSRDVSRVVNYIDTLNKSGSEKKLQQLKEMFGLGDIEHFDDFARYLDDVHRQLTQELTCISFLVPWRMGRGYGSLIPSIQAILASINSAITSRYG